MKEYDKILKELEFFECDEVRSYTNRYTSEQTSFRSEFTKGFDTAVLMLKDLINKLKNE